MGRTKKKHRASLKTPVLEELESSYVQVNSLPCKTGLNLRANAMHVPTHSIYRDRFCSVVRGATKDQCTMKIPHK